VDVHRVVAEQAPDAISLHDLTGRYRWTSPEFGRLLGYDPGWLLGRGAYEFIHPDDHSTVQAVHAAIVDGATGSTVQYRLRGADGVYHWVETTSRVVDDDVEERLIVAVTRPVGSRRSALAALQTERAVAQQLWQVEQQRQHFLTTVSHRARQPLTAITGMLELLAERHGDLPPERVNELLRRARHNAAALQRLIEEVTQAELLARRAARVRRRPVDLARLVLARVADIAGAEAAITVTIPDAWVVFADEELLDIAVRVLLDNAVEHTPLGTPVWIRAVPHDEGALLMVEDAGPGVDEDDRDAIFEPFVHGDVDHPDPGLGLGLSTVAEIAALHHGRVWVEERDGGGASFRLLLPRMHTIDLDDDTGRVLREHARDTGEHPVR
jgi:PAS domain S-box-containing protein